MYQQGRMLGLAARGDAGSPMVGPGIAYSVRTAFLENRWFSAVSVQKYTPQAQVRPFWSCRFDVML